MSQEKMAMRFLVEDSKRGLNFQVNGQDKIVTFFCHNCELKSITERLRYDSDIDLYHRSPYGRKEQKYTRVIFGIHPDIIKKVKYVMFRRSSAYFCSYCESKLSIYNGLFDVAKEVSGPEFLEGVGVSELISGKGTWITASRFGFGEEESFNLQVSLETLDRILEGLIEKFPTNPFRIIDLER
jgi:hypothetical protein